jgi:hypothetical protein
VKVENWLAGGRSASVSGARQGGAG